jgi:hypothetical protein
LRGREGYWGGGGTVLGRFELGTTVVAEINVGRHFAATFVTEWHDGFYLKFEI